MTTIDNPAAARIVAAQQVVRDAIARFEQLIRDEVNSGAITPSGVARALGTKNRQRVYSILGRNDPATAPTTVPTIPPVIYLRGAGCGDRVWAAVVEAMHARGWVTVRDRTTAWHLARGGARVVFCDFSSHVDGLSSDVVTVGSVRAKYEESTTSAPISDILTDQDRQRFRDEKWLRETVSTTVTDTVLPLISGGEFPRPETHDPEVTNKAGRKGAWTLDAPKLARLVADVLDE